ncbi:MULTISPECIES: helix-turn-helix transcriptional regulator [unclassified Variovorax]|uniref:helix-turn-helix domain-containing protein n=1 Tax=unclassified Variovorax TaxID=663243 RepID=UPI002576FE69|nr:MULTISPECIES: helix-turn-helix transcriptional regulator [unclassified Variovorax]MDM0091660.1 helix-turn-helix transcriptional regulator [Variovorax sp. J22G40]MDM0146017.1 helix-turn-helix transcriptional regulator [Variovorax sp. J2P1-31]
MSSIGSRLRDQRERLEYNQSDLAEIGGTTRKSQFLYETDARRPDADYLAAIAAVGLNVLFILTGSEEGAEPIQFTAEERDLLEHFRKAPSAVRKAAMGALLSATPTAMPRQERRPPASTKKAAPPRRGKDDAKKQG